MGKDQPHPSNAHPDGSLVQFSLLGGPFHDFVAKRLPSIGGEGAPALGAGLSVVLWAVLAILTAIEGSLDTFFSLQAIAIHVRMLVAIPLVFLCQVLFDGSIRVALSALVSNGILADEARTALDEDARRLNRASSSWTVQFGLLMAVVLFSIATPVDYLPGLSSNVGNLADATGTVALTWYWLFCLPVFRFVVARFVWLLGMWIYLLWRISRSELQLAAEDPDLAGGLGLLVPVQEKLVVFVAAIAVIDAATLAEIFQTTALNETLVYIHVFLLTLFGLLIIGGPMLFLTGPFRKCRRQGLVQFGGLGREYVIQFRRRWILPDKPDYRLLLGSGDIQSLADPGGAYSRMKSMRILPFTNRHLFVIFCCAAAPHLPLLLLKYPMTEILTDMIRKFIGI